MASPKLGRCLQVLWKFRRHVMHYVEVHGCYILAFMEAFGMHHCDQAAMRSWMFVGVNIMSGHALLPVRTDPPIDCCR